MSENKKIFDESDIVKMEDFSIAQVKQWLGKKELEDLCDKFEAAHITGSFFYCSRFLFTLSIFIVFHYIDACARWIKKERNSSSETPEY